MSLSFTKPKALEVEVQSYLEKGGQVHDTTKDGIGFVYWGPHKVYIVNNVAYRLKTKAKKAMQV